MEGKWIFPLMMACALSSPIWAELNDDSYTTQELLVNTQGGAQEDEGSPFSVSLDFTQVGKAKFEHKRCGHHLHDVEFSIADVDASAVFYYNPCCKEGLLATVGYTYTRIKWKNPFFDQDRFDTVSFGIAGFTERAERWTLQGQVLMNADVDYFKWSENIFWNIIFASKYSISECFNAHFGFIAFTGMKIDRLYPILGIDWTINDSWQLNLIYPLNISIVYTISDQWSVAIANRNFDERHRVGKAKKHKWDRGLIEYRSAGAEGAIRFQSCNKVWHAELYAGEMFGGRVKVSNKSHNHIHRYTFKSSPYFGGELAAKF